MKNLFDPCKLELKRIIIAYRYFTSAKEFVVHEKSSLMRYRVRLNFASTDNFTTFFIGLDCI